MPDFSYLSKNYVDYRTDIINYLTKYYGTSFSNSFNDAAVGSALIDIAAGVGDELSYHVDKRFTETQIDYAQERKSYLNMARTMGVNLPNKQPSVTLVDFTVTLPVNGDSFDSSYAPIIAKGAQVIGGGKVFETESEINFNSPFNSAGVPNRIVIPTINSNNIVENYKITKREVVIQGKTSISKKVITTTDVIPFMNLYLSDQDVINVDSIFILDGSSYSSVPDLTQYENTDYQWYQVDSLAQQEVFVEDTTYNNTTGSTNNYVSTSKKGYWKEVTKKFIVEFTDANYCKITFGGGDPDYSNGILSATTLTTDLISRFLNNLALGEIPSAGKTIFIKYKVGGGSDTNLGANTITTISNATITINGTNPTKKTSVRSSLTCNNPIAAVGGKDTYTIDELRYLIKYHNAEQERCVITQDYLSRIAKMNSKYGSPYKYCVYEYKNKIEIPVLSLDYNGNLTSSIPSLLLDNISEYLKNYRSFNDYVEIFPGKIVNLKFEADVIVNNSASVSSIVSNVINAISNYMDISKHRMGENIYLSNLKNIITNVAGVIGVSDLRVYNLVNGSYSTTYISQGFSDLTTNQIFIPDNTLYCEPDTCFEVKYPSKDILVRYKNS